MALSQLQCLDDNHVNLRTTESKPEFLYSEDQRLALEAFLRDGRDAFVKYLGARELRGFLSDLELEAFAETLEPYDPGTEIFPEDAEDDETPLSLHYWPELSDRSIPQMDLGWPDCASYRGVTRTTVYTQPPLEINQAHIKEVVRKMIAQAQKVIAVVMDVFTDVDIFRDLLDAGFKRKVSVYILLERSTLPHFRSMCQRAHMHAGHLKHLRVRCTDGEEFHTRSCTKVRGRMGHRFMFIDGDKAFSGSYSFTWTSSRLDNNLITVITGQAVEAFDKLFRVLYATSSSVDLRQATTEPEPEQEPIRQPAAVAPLSADMARKLYSPKYALAALGNPSTAPSAGLKETQNTDDSKNPGTKKRRGRRASQEAIQEAPPLHPGLIDLEKACMMSYLPTWPEPDPASDVIGFINIRDTRKPNQSHLQRSEMYESSQAIRFSSLFSKPQETLLDVAKPRDFTAQHKEMNRIQPARDKTKAEESVVGRAQSTQLQTGPGDTTKILNTGTKQHSNIPTKQDANQNSTPHLNSHKPVQSSSEASTPETGRPSHSSQTVTTLPGTNTKKEAETNSDTQHAALYRTHALELCSRQASHLRSPADTNSNTEPYTPTKTKLPQTDSHTQPQNVFSTPPLTSSSTTLNPPLPSSSASPSFTSTPPIPKPRTVQLFFKGDVTDNGQNLPEFRVVPMAETSKGSLVVRNEPAVETGVQTLPEKVSKTVPELQNNRESKTGTQLNAKETLNIGESPKKKKSGTSQETKNGEAVGRHEKAGMQLETGNKAKSDVVIADAPKAENVTIQEIIPKVVEPKALMSIDGVATVQADIKAPKRVPTGCEVSELPNEKSENVTEHKRYLARAHVPQRISYSELPPQDNNALESVDSLKAPTHTPVSATHISKDSASDSTHTDILSHGYPPALRTDSLPNTSKHNTHNTIQEPISKARGSTHTPERPLHLHLSEINTPDFRSRTPEREPRSLTALVRTPTPDIFLPRTPTSDSRTPTSDSRTPTPDSRTHTPDGYVTPRADSALSTASEEYYECSGSPLHDPVFERVVLRKHGTTEDHVSFAHTNTPHATSPAYINSNTCAATLGITYRNTSSSETQTLSEPARVSSSSEKWGEMREEKANDENGREEDEKGRTEDDYQGTERRASEEAKRTANHFKHGKDLTETKDKNKEAQAPKRKKLLIQFAAERQDDGGGTPGESTNEPKRSPTGDLQPTKERRDRPQSTDGQKLLHSPLKTVRGQKQESGGSFSFRPPRPTRPLSPNWALGPRPRGDRQLNQAESKMLLNNTLSPFRPPPPVNARQRQAEISHSQQGRTSVGQSQDQHPKPQASSLFTHSNREAQLHTHFQDETVSPREAQWQEEGRSPFSFSFSRLYNLKGLKDKMSKLPAQSKRGSASSPGQGPKSTS